MVFVEILHIVSAIGSPIAAFAAWRTSLYLSRAWKIDRDARVYNRLIREPMRVAHARYDEGVRTLAGGESLTEEELAQGLILLSDRFLATVRLLSGLKATDCSAVVPRIKRCFEDCDGDLNDLFAKGHSRPLLVGQLDSILDTHAMALADIIERYDPSMPQDSESTAVAVA